MSNEGSRYADSCLVAGAVNAVGFLAANWYTAHGRGIISTDGDDLAPVNFTTVVAGLASLVSFVLGATTTTIWANWGRRQHIHRRFGYRLLPEAVILLLFGIVGANLVIPP